MMVMMVNESYKGNTKRQDKKAIEAMYLKGMIGNKGC